MRRSTVPSILLKSVFPATKCLLQCGQEPILKAFSSKFAHSFWHLRPVCWSSRLAAALGVTNFITIIAMFFGHTLLCYLSPTWMFNKPTSKPFLGNWKKKVYNYKMILLFKKSPYSHQQVFFKIDSRANLHITSLALIYFFLLVS
jgi:hypothetical protein